MFLAATSLPPADWAVVVLVLMGGAIICLLVLLLGAPGGPVGVMEVAMEHDKFSLGSFALTDFATGTFWVIFLFGIVDNLRNFGIDQSYIQRYIAAKSDAAARRSVWLGSLLYIPVSALFFLIGTILWGVLGTGLALFLVQVTASALDMWWALSGIIGGGMTGLFLLGIINKRAGNTAAIAGVIAGVLTISWVSWPKIAGLFGHNVETILHAQTAPVLGVIVTLLAGSMFSLIANTKSKQP